MPNFSRRNFLATSTVAATTLANASARADSNDRIRAAVLGVNGRGRTHIEQLEKQDGVELAMICDPDERVLGNQAKRIEDKFGHKVETATDMRKVFDRDDIDVVTVATPNHWHSLATIWACQAGKDVYVEKPGSHNLFEGRKMVEAAHRYKRIVQHGVQLRSSAALQEAVEHLRKGTIGDVYMARGIVFRWRPSIGKKQPIAKPNHLDWDLWQGPAQSKPYSPRYVHYNWHWHWDYGNGDVGNQGVHETDMCMWGLDVGLPSKITAMGGKFLWDDDKETPEVLTSCYHYPDEKKMIQFEVRHWNTNDEQGARVGNIFYGSKGILVVGGYDSYVIYLGQRGEVGPSRSEGGELERHFANFIQAVRERKPEIQNGPVESAHLSSGLAHLGNIAYRLERQLEFDPKTEKFVNDAEADEMLTRQYREPFVVPNAV
ncbi:MAG: Gfo/Idh/MocA family oxidoreductase [Planctomycetales bacterium]|nr:Gfo/Idh/MocA family oxidoreductase [Planctomycetales bacterium]